MEEKVRWIVFEVKLKGRILVLFPNFLTFFHSIWSSMV